MMEVGASHFIIFLVIYRNFSWSSLLEIWIMSLAWSIDAILLLLLANMLMYWNIFKVIHKLLRYFFTLASFKRSLHAMLRMSNRNYYIFWQILHLFSKSRGLVFFFIEIAENPPCRGLV